MVRLSLPLGLLLSLGGLLCQAESDITGNASPSAAHQIPVRLGSVDAVRGNLSLSLPLGPRMPGRIPIGATWYFDSLDSAQFLVGGMYRAAVWPHGSIPKPTTTVQIGSTTYSFQKHYAATVGNALHPLSIQFTNLSAPTTEWVRLDLTLVVVTTSLGQSKFQMNQSPTTLADATNLATLTITNGMGLPSVSLEGMHRTLVTADGLRTGFIPSQWAASADSQSVQTQFTWATEGTEEVPTTAQDLQGPGFTKFIPSPVAMVAGMTHPNGLVERFGYDVLANLSAKAFTTDGNWAGYRSKNRPDRRRFCLHKLIFNASSPDRLFYMQRAESRLESNCSIYGFNSAHCPRPLHACNPTPMTMTPRATQRMGVMASPRKARAMRALAMKPRARKG